MGTSEKLVTANLFQNDKNSSKCVSSSIIDYWDLVRN